MANISGSDDSFELRPSVVQFDSRVLSWTPVVAGTNADGFVSRIASRIPKRGLNKTTSKLVIHKVMGFHP